MFERKCISFKWLRTQLLNRHYCSQKVIRVRFAPSPTGYLHLGGLRTALYNYLFAKSQKGKFILRIEDTDRKRTIPGSCDKILQDLIWCGIIPDEGPSIGGNFGPYVQSLRQEFYTEAANRLIDSGAAYYCFCSEKRLDLLRKDASKNNLVPKYDNRCRNLSKEEILSKLSSRAEKCIRFKLTTSEPFNDLVYGTVVHEVEDIEGDPIILKKDGWPTYHLANVVDDFRMNISHVIRGVEWLQSTNKHLMMYKALGYNPPQFAHLPLLLNSDGTKFSKRQQNLSLESLREKGIFPRTLINLISHTSSGFADKKKFNSSISLDQLVYKFDLSGVGTSSTRLPLDRLNEFNKLEISRQINNQEELHFLILQVKEIVQKTFPESKFDLDLKDEHIKKVLLWSAPRISFLKDLVNKDLEFLWVKPNEHYLELKDIDIINVLMKELIKQEFDNKNTLNIFLKNFSNKNNIPIKEFMSLLRKIISGLQSGPGVAEMMTILGKNTCLERIDQAIHFSHLKG